MTKRPFTLFVLSTVAESRLSFTRNRDQCRWRHGHFAGTFAGKVTRYSLDTSPALHHPEEPRSTQMSGVLRRFWWRTEARSLAGSWERRSVSGFRPSRFTATLTETLSTWNPPTRPCESALLRLVSVTSAAPLSWRQRLGPAHRCEFLITSCNKRAKFIELESSCCFVETSLWVYVADVLIFEL